MYPFYYTDGKVQNLTDNILIILLIIKDKHAMKANCENIVLARQNFIIILN